MMRSREPSQNAKRCLRVSTLMCPDVIAIYLRWVKSCRRPRGGACRVTSNARRTTCEGGARKRHRKLASGDRLIPADRCVDRFIYGRSAGTLLISRSAAPPTPRAIPVNASVAWYNSPEASAKHQAGAAAAHGARARAATSVTFKSGTLWDW